MKIRKDKIVDLEYLADFSFSELEIDAPGLRNISSIDGNDKLVSLSIRGEFMKPYLPAFGTDFPGYLNDPFDLSALKNLPALKKLVLGPGVRNVEFLKNLTSVTELSIEDAVSLNGVESLMNLRQLTIGECAGLDSLKPLHKLSLASLSFFATRFTKSLWVDFMEYVQSASGVVVEVDKYRNIPKKHILSVESISGISGFHFHEDSYFGNSFGFEIRNRDREGK